jgi:ATP-dependent Clp protease protease subunit
MKPFFLTPLLALALAAACPADPAQAPEHTKSAKPDAPLDPASEAVRKQQDQLTLENNLDAERLKKETNQLHAEITRLKMERELATEKLATETAKIQSAAQSDILKSSAERDDLSRQADVSKARAEKLSADLKALQTESSIELAKLQNQISRIETEEKRAQYSDTKPVYLESPLRPDGTLVISDRRVPLNGPITSATADYVTNRIQYFNNKDHKMPIFLVIDDSPGGSVMAGYRILRSMDASEAPVHVVVKSFAASMAAAIATLAKESYAYPNAVILHHQVSSQIAFARLNLTQQKELYQESQRWWTRLGGPIAAKMGLTTEEFIKQMYIHSSTGDWSEFADEACKLKWVDHVVARIDESAVVKNPDLAPSPREVTAQINGLKEELDSDGHTAVYLPRLNPQDVYFIYNPDSYYRAR